MFDLGKENGTCLNQKKITKLELVSKELNDMAAILHVYAGVWF